MILWEEIWQSSKGYIMGFADLSIAEIAADYNLAVEQVLHLCDRLGIAYKTPQTRLPLEDAKAVILLILSEGEQGSQGQDFPSAL